MSEGEGGKSAWSEWVRPLLLGALAAAPLEFGDLWACALRYGVYALAEAKDPSLGLLLDVISHPLPEGVLPARNLPMQCRNYQHHGMIQAAACPQTGCTTSLASVSGGRRCSGNLDAPDGHCTLLW